MDLILQLDYFGYCERNLRAHEPLLLLCLCRPTAAPCSAATLCMYNNMFCQYSRPAKADLPESCILYVDSLPRMAWTRAAPSLTFSASPSKNLSNRVRWPPWLLSGLSEALMASMHPSLSRSCLLPSRRHNLGIAPPVDAFLEER